MTYFHFKCLLSFGPREVELVDVEVHTAVEAHHGGEDAAALLLDLAVADEDLFFVVGLVCYCLFVALVCLPVWFTCVLAVVVYISVFLPSRTRTSKKKHVFACALQMPSISGAGDFGKCSDLVEEALLPREGQLELAEAPVLQLPGPEVLCNIS